MRKTLITFCPSIAFAIVGYVPPIKYPHLSPTVSNGLLWLAAAMFVAAALLWIRSPNNDAGATAQQSGKGNNQFTAPVSGPVHIGDIHHYDKPEAEARPAEPKPRNPMHISRSATALSRKEPPPEPNLSLNGVTARVYKILGPVPSDEARKDGFRRRVNLEIGDQAFGRNMTVWARFEDRPRNVIVNDRLKHARFDHQKQKLVIVLSTGKTMTFTDVMFNRSECDEVWPAI